MYAGGMYLVLALFVQPVVLREVLGHVPALEHHAQGHIANNAFDPRQQRHDGVVLKQHVPNNMSPFHPRQQR